MVGVHRRLIGPLARGAGGRGAGARGPGGGPGSSPQSNESKKVNHTFGGVVPLSIALVYLK